MGRRNRHIITDPSLYFVTSTVRDWQNLFTDEKLDEFENLLFSVSHVYADALLGYVLMPSHFHLLVRCNKGGRQLSKFVGSLKSLSARQIFSNEGSIWMQRFDDLVIMTEKQLWIKLEYIHSNPVKSGLAPDALSWKWSSARFWSGDDSHPVLTKDWDWLSCEGA